MPVRAFSRAEQWLLPPSVDELIGREHPARFVGAVVDAVSCQMWAELGVDPAGQAMGAPAYHPAALLSVWLYGFMIGLRSSRKLEGACRDQLPFLWLTGNQRPDHNTLWRFYQGHRQSLHVLFRQTVRTAVRAGLVDLAVQALDGTKVAANASRERTYDSAGLRRLLERTDAAIAALERENEDGDDPPPPRLPQELAQQQALRAKVSEALEQVQAEDGPSRLNLTDADAALVKSRQGIIAGYNAQAMVAAVAPDRGTGLLMLAADVTTDAADYGQLLPLLAQAEQTTQGRADMTVADAGYHSGANVSACAQQGYAVAMPEAQARALAEPHHKTHFVYDAANDTYRCPTDQVLRRVGMKRREAGALVVYRADGAVCQRCPAFGVCTTNRHGRSLEVSPHEPAMRAHRHWMAEPVVQAAYRRRKQLVEPSFGILKEHLAARRFLLRGLVAVRAEWHLLATAFNLRTLHRAWCTGQLVLTQP